MKRIDLGAALALWALLPGSLTTAHAGTGTEALRAEFARKLADLQQEYEARLQQFEAREALSGAATMDIAAEGRAQEDHEHAGHDGYDGYDGHDHDGDGHSHGEGHAGSAVMAGAAATGSPQVGLLLQGAYVSRPQTATAPGYGFLAAPREGDSRGFSLGGTEVMLSAPVNEHFRGYAGLVLNDDQVEVEEAWVQSRWPGQGLSLKGGRFLSAVGQANEQHAHHWDFADQSLMYRVLFGEHLRQDGVQLQWRTTVPQAPQAQQAPQVAQAAHAGLHLTVGAEIAQGQFFPGSTVADGRSAAGSWATFIRLGGEGRSGSAWRAGLGLLAAQPVARSGGLRDGAGNEFLTAFSGNSRLWLADFVWQWSPLASSAVHGAQGVKLQGALFRRMERGTLSCLESPAVAEGCAAQPWPGNMAYRARLGGGYGQGVYRFQPEWGAGYRLDWLDAGTEAVRFLNFPAERFRPLRHSLMTEYQPAWAMRAMRLRLQWARARVAPGVMDQQWTLQYLFSLGGHGAHSF